MKKWILYIILSTLPSFAEAYFQATDSLIDLYEKADTKNEQGAILKELCQANRDYNPEAMKFYAGKLLELGERDTADTFYGWGNYYMGEFFYLRSELEKSEFYFLKALQTFTLTDSKKGLGETAASLATIYFYEDRYRSALNFANTALDKFYALEDLLKQANILALICEIYTYMDNYNQAIQYCVQSLRIKEKLNIVRDKEVILNTMGTIYQGLGTYKKASEYLFSALEFAKRNNEPYNIATTYSNIGNYYLETNDTDSALFFFKKAMKIDSIAGDSVGLSYSYFDVAKVQRQLGENELAEYYLRAAQKLAREYDMPELSARIGLELGDLLTDQDFYEKAIIELKNSLVIAQKINSTSLLADAYQKLAKYYDRINDSDNALVYMRLYMLESEKKYREENIKSIAEIETLYKIEKKEKEIALLRKENDIKQLQSEQRMFILIAMAISSFLLIVLIVILYNRNKLKNRANKALQIRNEAIQQQKTEIEHQKEELSRRGDSLSDKNKQITDSIIYAKQIQESLLPSINLFKEQFSKSFIYYKPKDIVSGDFYWHAKIDNKLAIAVVDCTGHGVPGAFMTVLANSLLNQIILETGISSPDLVVSLLDQKIQQNLHQKQLGSNSTDGLDIGLIFIQQDKRTIEFTGAKIPLFIAGNGQSQIIKADRFSVGSTQEHNKVFTKKQLKIEKDSMLYLSTDGYQDQFGGPHDKKFMKPNFYELLGSIHHLSAEEQENQLEQKFQQWRGGKAQTDDILVLGIKL